MDLDQIFTLLASLGLSFSAGVRAYLPILILGIASDVGPVDLGPLGKFQMHLRSGFDWIGNPFFLVLIGLLTIYEFSADKIPVIDHLNDVVHTIIRPLAGALIVTATTNSLSDSGSIGAWTAAIIGAGLAGTSHTVKAAVVRPTSTATTAGLANPLISLVEDVMVLFTSLLAVLLPFLAILVPVLLFLTIWLVVRRLRRRNRPVLATSK